MIVNVVINMQFLLPIKRLHELSLALTQHHYTYASGFTCKLIKNKRGKVGRRKRK